MAAISLKSPVESHPRSDQSRRLSELREAAERVRVDLAKGTITSEEASERLEMLTRRHRTFLNRFLDL